MLSAKGSDGYGHRHPPRFHIHDGICEVVLCCPESPRGHQPQKLISPPPVLPECGIGGRS